MRLQQSQKQSMSFVKKAAIIGGASLVIAIMAFVGIKVASVDNTYAGATYSWTGKVNSDWNNRKNWQGNSLPTNGSSVEIGAYTSAPEIGRNSNFYVNDITLNSGAELTVSANLTVKGNVVLDDESILSINKGTTNLAGDLQLIGEDVSVRMRNGSVKVGGDLLLVSVNDADSTYLRVFNGKIEVTGITYFLKDNSTADAFIEVKNGAVELNETEKEYTGFENGRILFFAEGGNINILEDFILEDNSGSFTPTPSSPCNSATAWVSSTTYQRLKTETIYVTHNSKTYYMKANKYWSKGDEPGKNASIWIESSCKDYCDLAVAWDSKTQFKRANGGDEVYVTYKGYVYELAYDVWWSQNHPPESNTKYW
ncbi:MAG: hypothetical protein ACPGLV_18730 [Bacteroidia bacterium]